MDSVSNDALRDRYLVGGLFREGVRSCSTIRTMSAS